MSAANSTMSTLSNLSKKLQLAEGVKGLANVTAAAKNVNLEPVTKGADTLMSKFSALEVVGVTALVNITNKAVDAGLKFAKSLTVEPILDGLKEYETKMNAIQTIMTNTASKGTTLTDINGALAELNKYSDQTIYNFAQMTDNIGKATAAGVGLEDSVIFVKGLANVAAGFGVDAMSMAGATQQMTQALASGTIRLQDWMSMENRGMGGQMLQDALVQTAKEMGVYVDTSIGFRNTLQDNWLSSEIFIKTMEKMANDQSLVDAATKVKTFTQLTDVMKEAVGSGWAMSWEHIIGDKNESTELFTGISNGFSKIVGSMADYRNEGLKNWKALGGREDILRGLERIFYSFSNILGPIYEAFKKIFDPWNGKGLKDLSVGFKQLMQNMVVTKATGEKIGKTFEGLFAVIKLVLSLFKPLLSFITGMLGTGGSFIDMIFSFTASIGEWAIKLTEWVNNSQFMTDAMTFMTNAGQNFGDIMRNVFQNASKYITVAMGKITEWGGVFGDWMSVASNKAWEYMKVAGEALVEFNEKYKPLQNAGKYIGMAFDSIVSGIKGFISFIKQATTNIQDLFQSITNRMKEADITGTDVMKTGIFAVIALAVKKIFTFLKELKSGAGDVIGSLTGALDSVKESMEAYQKSLNADMITKIAIAIGILAASVFLLTKVNPDNLAPAVAALVALGAGLTVMLKLLEGFDPAGLKASAGMFIAAIGIATAASILASALVKLSTINWDELKVALVGFGAVMVSLVAALKILDGVKMSASTGIAVLGIAAGVLVLAKALEVMSNIPWDKMTRGILGLAAVFVTLSIFSLAIKKAGKDYLLAAVGMNLLGSAMTSMAGGLLLLSMLKVDQVKYAGLMLIGLLTTITLFAHVVKGCGANLLMATVAMNLLSTALIGLAGAIFLYSKIPWDTFITGLRNLGMTLGVIGLAMRAFPKNLAIQAGGFIALSVAIGILTVCLMGLAKIKLGDIVKGLGTLAALFLVLGAAAFFIGPLATGLLVLAGAMAVLGVAVALVGGGLFLFSLSLGAVAASGVAAAASLGAALVMLAAIFPTITAAIALGIVSFITVLGHNTPTLTRAFIKIIEAICTTIVETAPNIAAAATALIVSFCDTIINSFPKIMETLVVLITSVVNAVCQVIMNNLPIMMETLVTVGVALIQSICTVIIEGYPSIMEAFVTVVTELLAGLTELLPTISQFVITSFDTILQTVLTLITNSAITVCTALTNFFVKICTLMATNIPIMVDAAAELAAAILVGIATFVPKMAIKAFEMIITFIDGLADAISTNGPRLRASIKRLGEAIVKEFKAFIRPITQVGGNIISGLKTGIIRKFSDIKNAAVNVVSGAVSAVKSFLGIHSPSRVFAEIGEFSDEGMVNGLLKGAKSVADAGVTVGDGALTGMQNAMADVGNLFAMDSDLNPVIKPVVDLSEVQNGASVMNSMMPRDYNMSLKANVSRANQALSSMNSRVGANMSDTGITNNNTTNETINHFTINGAQDPKAVANEVSKIIDQQVKRRNAVWA